MCSRAVSTLRALNTKQIIRLVCPQVYEVVPCQSDCNQYVWVAEPWSVWKVSNVDLKENCGEGVQTRKVRYVWSLDS